MKKLTIHGLLLVCLVLAVGLPLSGSTLTNNNILSMAGNGDTWDGLGVEPSTPLMITHFNLISSGGAKQYVIKNGTASTGQPIFAICVAGTAGTTKTLDIDTPSGVPISATKGIRLFTDDAASTGLLNMTLNTSKK